MTQLEVKIAQALEADADAYPDERGEILVEAAEAWRRAGDNDRAMEILAELLHDGGEDGCEARVALVDLYFETGDDDGAYAELVLLAKDPALSDAHCVFAAELLAERGDLHQALRWYDRAAARLTDEELTALRGGAGRISLATAMMLGGRREVREQLDLIPDVLDGLVPDLPSSAPSVAPSRPGAPVTSEDALGMIDAGVTMPGRMRMLTFQRAERAEARRRWPDQYEQPDEEYYAAAEDNWRRLRDSGVPTLVVVAAKVAELVLFASRTGGSPTDPDVKRRYCQSVPDRDTIAWPPARNAPCWCGSAAKYKKCCGRPTT